LAVECAGDIQITERDCERAMKDTKNVESKVACIKDILADKKACWSCICEVTKKYIDLKEC
jgi:hypothetical protein